MHYNVINLIQKVYDCTGNDLSKNDGVYFLCSLVEQNKLLLSAEIHSLKSSLSSLNDSLNGCNPLIFDQVSSSKISSYIYSISSGESIIFSHVKEMLSPYWKVYWSEGCTDLNIIADWIARAESDNYKKLNDFKACK